MPIFMKRKIGFTILFCCKYLIFGQNEPKLLSLGIVLQIVKENHPYFKAIQLMPESANAYVRYAKGNLDPKLQYLLKNKFYKNTNYYEIGESGLEIPTWFGPNFFLGLDNNRGTYINPEDQTPSGGLASIGFNMPLLRNLLYDKRRLAIQEARNIEKATDWEVKHEINELLLSILSDYIQWKTNYDLLQLQTASIENAKLRLNQLKTEADAGSRAALDTIEIAMVLAQFRLQKTETEYKFLKSRLELSNHLWSADQKPLEISSTTIPAYEAATLIDSLFQFFSQQVRPSFIDSLQPNLQIMAYEIKNLDLQKKFKKQNILPELNLTYHTLHDAGKFTSNNYFQNYYFGLKAGSSLFLRKERGEYQLAKIKLNSAELKYDFKRREVNNKIAIKQQASLANKSIFEQYKTVNSALQELLKAELIRLEAGESNMFVVNTREIRVFDAQQKLIQYEQKWLESNIEFLKELGVLWQLL